MLEFLLFVMTVVLVRVLTAPLVRRFPSPGWFERLRARGRPGVPVVTVAGVLVMMLILWLIGERRGVFGFLLMTFWVGTPVLAWIVLSRWWARDSVHRPGE